MPTSSGSELMNIKIVEEHYKEQVGQMRKENEHLKSMVLRLNKELLKAHPSYDALADSDDYEEPLPPWVVNSHYLSPLIESYERALNDMNSEVQELIKQYHKAESTIKAQNADILELRAELELKYNNVLSTKNFADNSYSNNAFNAEEKEEYLDHIEKLSEENNSLLLLNEKLTKRADDSTRELNSKGRELEEKLNVWNDLENALTCTRERELNIKNQKEMLESRVSNLMEELGELENDRDTYYNKYLRLDKDAAVLKNRADKYEQAYKESEAKRNEEIDSLAAEINMISSREKEAIQKCIIYERENEELREMRKELDNEISANRKEFDAMVRVMEDLESNLNNRMAREDSIDSLIKENNRKVEEALMERDRAVRRENTLLKTIEKCESDMRQLSTDLDYKHTNLTEGLRTKHQNILKSKEQELSEVYQRISSLENQIERLERENRNYKSESVKYHENSKNMMTKTNDKMEELEKKLILAESEKENVKNEFKMTSEQLKEEKRIHERTTRQLESKLSQVINDFESTRREKNNCTDEIKRIMFRIEDVERERNLAIEESDNLRNLHNEKLNECVKEYSSKNMYLERSLKESLERIRVSETRATEIIKLQEKLSDKWKKEHIATVKYYETIMSDYQGELSKYKKSGDGGTGSGSGKDERYSRDYANKGEKENYSRDRESDLRGTFERDREASFGVNK